MPSLPALDLDKGVCHSPHVVILGAGCSIAACPNGDKNGKKLPSMDNFISVLGLNENFPDLSQFTGKNFEHVYQHLANSKASYLAELNAAIWDYFASLKLSDKPTLYDLLILTLRDKDIIATFNWDPFLAQAYQRNLRPGRMPRIVFLHGNVKVGVCHQCKSKGFLANLCTMCKRNFERTGLLYPIQTKGYRNDPFISNEWDELEGSLKHAYMITIFGYSAPVSDVEAIDLINQAWSMNNTRSLSALEIIDIKSESALDASWSRFNKESGMSYSFGYIKSLFESPLTRYPRRTCEAYSWATLQQDPIREKRLKSMPESMSQLRDFFEPLIVSEDQLEKYGTRLSHNEL